MGFFLVLFLWPVFLLLVIALILVPFQFSIYSLVNIVTIPGQLIKIAFNPRLRANHALEHAAINVVEERVGTTNLSGLAKEDGFLIKGRIDPSFLEDAAREGLFRIQQGETDLALHRRCGSSILAAKLVSAIMFVFLFWASGWFSIFSVLAAFLAGQVLAPSAGVFIQRWLTTSPDVQDYKILRVETEVPAASASVFTRFPAERFFVRTWKQK